MLGKYKILRDGKLEEVNITTSISAVEGLATQLADKISSSKDTVINASHTYKNPLIIDGQNNYIDIGRKNNWFWTRFSGENWTFNNTYTGGSWARNLLEMKDAKGNAYFRIGAQGSSQNFTQMYIGPTYDKYWISFNNSRADVKVPILMNSNKVSGLADPTSAQDAVNLRHLDARLGGYATVDYVSDSIDNIALIADQIPSLPASKITSGRFSKDRLPTDTVFAGQLDQFATRSWTQNYVANERKLKTKYAYTWVKGDGLTPLETSHDISTLINNREFPLFVTVDVGVDDEGAGRPQTTHSRGSVSFTISSPYTGGIWDFRGDTPGGTVEFNHWELENNINLILTSMGQEYYTYVEVMVYG